MADRLLRGTGTTAALPRVREHACVRRASGWTPCRRAQGTGRGRERDLRDAIESRRTGGIGFPSHKGAARIRPFDHAGRASGDAGAV